MGKGSKIGVITAAIVGINAMIGAGIFSMPATLASTSGIVTLSTYIFVILSVWLMAISLSRVAKLFPEEGSFYTYVKSWGGHKMGMVAAGAYITGVLIAMGLLAKIAGGLLYQLIPFGSPAILTLVLLSVLVFLNTRGVKLSSAGQFVLVCTTLFPIITTILLCLTKTNFSYLAAGEPATMGGILTATSSVIFGFFGFEAAASLFSVVKNPEKNVPRAITYSILFVGSLYFIFVGAVILAVPAALFAGQNILLSSVLVQVFPAYKWLIWLIHLTMLSAITGTLHSMIWSASTLLNTFVEQTRKKIPAKFSILFVGGFIAVTALTIKSVYLFFNLTAFFIVSAYFMAILSLLFIKKEWVSGRNIITICGLITAVFMIVFALYGAISLMVS